MFDSLNNDIDKRFADLRKDVEADLHELENATAQLKLVSTIVNNFVNQTLQLVSENEDPEEARNVAVNSLVQINNFVANRPDAIEKSMKELLAKVEAYKASSAAVKDAITAAREAHKAETEASKRILEDIDETGRYTKRRKIGEKPEKLRDVRNVESKIKRENIEREDI